MTEKSRRDADAGFFETRHLAMKTEDPTSVWFSISNNPGKDEAYIYPRTYNFGLAYLAVRLTSENDGLD